jgi:hypothetical protein
MARGSSAFDGIISDASAAWDVPAALIKAIIEKESGFDPNAYRAEPQIGDASRGLMQLLYGTAQALGFAGEPDDLYDPTTNKDRRALRVRRRFSNLSLQRRFQLAEERRRKANRRHDRHTFYQSSLRR